jgi:RNA polymerase sigma-70 factor, ECF subfamily
MQPWNWSQTPMPMTANDSFAVLMRDLRAGDEAAAGVVFHRFARRLIALARARLDDRLQRKEDPEDVLQSVFCSFFLRYREGEFEFDNWESLWGVLTLITLRKCGNHLQFFRAARRRISREASGDSSAGWPAVDPEPTPEQAAVLTETLELLMQRLEPRDREILTFHLQGCEAPEISARVRRAQRTVRRVLDRIRQSLERGLSP